MATTRMHPQAQAWLEHLRQRLVCQAAEDAVQAMTMHQTNDRDYWQAGTVEQDATRCDVCSDVCDGPLCDTCQVRCPVCHDCIPDGAGCTPPTAEQSGWYPLIFCSGTCLALRDVVRTIDLEHGEMHLFTTAGLLD